MKNSLRSYGALRLWWTILLGVITLSVRAESSQTIPTNAPISWDQIGAKAGADYKGDGLTVVATQEGARLHCVFQRIEGKATRAGLWLTSTLASPAGDRFQVKAVSLGRCVDFEKSPVSGARQSAGAFGVSPSASPAAWDRRSPRC